MIFALNFLDYFNVFSLDSVFEHHYNKAPAVFDALFPSHKLKQVSQEETITAVTPAPTEVIPTLEPTDEPTQAPSTEAPATQAPVSSEAPAATSANVG